MFITIIINKTLLLHLLSLSVITPFLKKDDGFVGTLFLPNGEGPFPAVINMYGGIYRGTVVEDRSAMLASRGIASLALAYFGVPGLPKSYIE